MDQLELLYALQQKDTELQSLREQEAGHPLRSETEDCRAALEQAEKDLAARQEELAAVEKGQKKQEDELDSLSRKIKGEEEKLYGGGVANPKELRGLQAEVKFLGKKRDELETGILEGMESIEQLTADVGRLQGERDGKQSDLAQLEANLAAELQTLADRMTAVEAEKTELRPQIPEDLLKTYDTLLRQQHNLAVVKVVDGVCQGCRMELPGQDYDRFKRTNGVFKCSTCGRILVK